MYISYSKNSDNNFEANTSYQEKINTDEFLLGVSEKMKLHKVFINNYINGFIPKTEENTAKLLEIFSIKSLDDFLYNDRVKSKVSEMILYKSQPDHLQLYTEGEMATDPVDCMMIRDAMVKECDKYGDYIGSICKAAVGIAYMIRC